MAGIFISYRQTDSKAWAIGLRDDLAKAFGDDQVFLDKDALGPGNWRDQLQRALERCSVVLVVIGKQWITIADEHNRPRISLPDDVHRQEIALALSHKGVTVIPVLVDDAAMPKTEHLPEDIRGLTAQQTYKIGDTKARRKADLAVLVTDIAKTGGLAVQASYGNEAQHRSFLKPDVPAVLLACGLTVLLAMVWSGTDSLNMAEKSVVLIVLYVLIVFMKFLWSSLIRRSRRVA